MPIKDKIIESLRLPEARAIKDLDDPQATVLHSQIVRQKKFLSEVYNEFYNRFKEGLGDVTGNAVLVELGSGGGFIKDILPSVITSDILQIPIIDVCFSGESMPFPDASVDAFLMIDVFHHIKEPAHLLKEMERCLKKGGKIIMIEPANTLWARFIWKNFHHENFDPKAGWKIEGYGPMSNANGALPWIIFCRDRKKFKNNFAALRLKKITYHTPFLYLLSGGMSMKQLLPGIWYGFIKIMEFLATPFNACAGMFFTIQLEKEK